MPLYRIKAYVDRVTTAVEVIDARDRADASEAARRKYGSEVAGIEALDVDCQWCEDRPVVNAAHWTDSSAPKYLPCPRCGRTHEGD